MRIITAISTCASGAAMAGISEAPTPGVNPGRAQSRLGDGSPPLIGIWRISLSWWRLPPSSGARGGRPRRLATWPPAVRCRRHRAARVTAAAGLPTPALRHRGAAGCGPVQGSMAARLALRRSAKPHSPHSPNNHRAAHRVTSTATTAVAREVLRYLATPAHAALHPCASVRYSAAVSSASAASAAGHTIPSPTDRPARPGQQHRRTPL